MNDKRILVIAGPTAVGKTEYAIEAAKAFDGEIVSCDSMQLYKYMDIGSAKPTQGRSFLLRAIRRWPEIPLTTFFQGANCL